MDSKYFLPQDGGLILEGTPRDIIHRYEKIPTSIFSTESEGVEYVASLIVKAITTPLTASSLHSAWQQAAHRWACTASWLHVIRRARCRSLM